MTTQEEQSLKRLDRLIDTYIDKTELSVTFCCEELGMSRSQLHRLIKGNSQLSLSLYIRYRRLDRAKQLLQTTSLRIIEIGEQVGIPTPQNFTKYFTEYTGTTPSEYRRSCQQAGEPVESVPDELAMEPASTDTLLVAAPPPAATTRALPYRNGRRWLAAGLLLLGLLGWYLWRHQQLSSVAEPSLAVLPFENLGTAQTRYFSEGVVEQIQASLLLIRELRVIARSSTMAYQKTSKPVARIARELGVNYLLNGSVLQEGQRVRLSVELIQAADNRMLWTHTYEGDLKDMFGFTSGVARQVAQAMNQTLSEVIHRKLNEAPTQNTEAYTEYLKGGYLMRLRTQEGLRASLLNFDRAIALDSAFADAYANKALVYFLMATEGYDATDTSLKLAEKNALTAIRYDAENAQAYAMLAKFYQHQNKWEEANTTYQIALNYQPNDALINYWYSLMLRSTGQLESAVTYSAKALRLDPLYPIILVGHLGNLCFAGRFAEARAVVEEGQRLHGSVYSWYWGTGFYYLCQQQYPQALKAFEKGLALNPAATGFAVHIAYLKARMGQAGPARQLLRALPPEPHTFPDRAILYAGLGDTAACLTYLEKGAPTGRLPYYLMVSPQFRFLRTHPRFQAVLRQVGLSRAALPTG